MEEALQWWYEKKLRQLESEANLIREQLLQESFAMRRSLELSSIKSNKLASSHQKYVEQLENFHYTLKEMSDRLSFPCINQGLPFALQYLIKKWQEKFPLSQFKFKFPQKWQETSQDNNFINNFIILDTIEDLFKIQLLKSCSTIFLTLKQDKNYHQLKITFTYQHLNKMLSKKNQEKLKNMQKIFEVFTFGSCKNIQEKNSNVWLFQW